jgi:hypothetical protein
MKKLSADRRNGDAKAVKNMSTNLRWMWGLHQFTKAFLYMRK